MKISFKTALGITFSLAALLLMNACKEDPLYDLNKGIDPQVKVGGDSLALPIGSTDSIKLGDFLSPEDVAFLKTMGDGGYGFSMSDSIVVDDLLSSLDKSKLKLDNQVFSQNVKVNFGDIDISEFKIPGFTINQNIDLNIPNVNIGNITPNVNLSNNYTVDFSKYVMDDSKMTVPNNEQNTVANDLVANVSPLNLYSSPINPSFQFQTTEPIDIGDLSVNIIYSIEVPEGITNIYQIDLNAGAKLEITLELDTAEQSLSAGVFTPNISIDPGNIFKFSPLSPLTDGKIVFGNNNSMTNFNDYSTVKSYDIVAFQNLPSAINNAINLSKLVTVNGNMSAQGTVRENKVLEAKKIDMTVKVVIKDVKINNLDFDVPSLTTNLSGTSPFSINNTLPTQVKTVNKIYFGKTAGSTLPTNLVIEMKPSNMPTMKSRDFKINNLNITFPNNFSFSNLSGKTFTATNAAFDPVTGYKIELDLSEIDLSTVNLNGGVLNWTDNISYSGSLTFNGRMDSKNINTSVNPKVDMSSQSAIKLNSASIVTNTITENLSSTDLAVNMNVDISNQVARLGSINVKPGSFIRVNINKPTLPLALNANGITIAFSSLFEFKPTANLNQNSYTINGTIPEFIELELKALHINKDLVDGKLTLNEQISISGGVSLLSGTVSSTQIEAMSTEKMSFQAVVSDIFIESTSLEMKTLEASLKDSTALNLSINEIPSQIKSLDSILIKDGATMKLDIQINNMPDLGGKPLNANIKVKFPKMLKFGAGQVNAENEMVINEAFVAGKLAKSVNLKALKFDGSDLNGKITIDEEVGFDVNVSVVNPTINSADLVGKDISVDVKVTIAGVEFKSVYGKFDVDISDQLNIPNVGLDDIPAILKGNDVVLDIAKPVISFSTESNIGIPVSAEMSMTKIIGGVLQNNDKLTFTVNIPKAASPAQTVKTGFWISPSSSGMPTGYQFIERPVQNLFKPLPDAFKVELKPTVNTSVQHLIDLTAKYNMKVKYDVIIPFSFGKDLSIVVRDTVENIDLVNDFGIDLGDLDPETGSLELMATILNSIPLDLKLQMIIMDMNDVILSTTNEQTILAGAPNGSAVSSNINIKLADNLGDLLKMNKVALVFRATSNTTVAGTPIKPDNFIKATLKAKVNGGITVNLPIKN
jgi:hypothetical protein